MYMVDEKLMHDVAEFLEQIKRGTVLSRVVDPPSVLFKRASELQERLAKEIFRTEKGSDGTRG